MSGQASGRAGGGMDDPAGTVAPIEEDWAAALGLLAPDRAAGPPDVTLLCHVSPDGDALGSMLALGIALHRLGVPVRCSWGNDPLVVPPAYRGLAGLELVVPAAEVPARPDVVVTLDTGSIDRLGILAGQAKAARALLVIDHHASNTRFGTHHLLDTAAAATAVLVSELIDRLGVPYDVDIAAGLYTGLTTDTGSFKYPATTPSVHGLAARLLATGLRHDLIARAVWDTHPAGYLRVLGAALDRLRLDPAAVGGLGAAWTWTTADDLRGHDVLMEEIEGVIDVVRTAEEAEVAIVCKGDLDGTLKVSTRSKGQVDVGAACVALGGGGHRFAAGFTSCDGVDATVGRLLALLAEAPHLSS
ncbi:MAG: DHH family phosphoesterase [Frankiaceae bacterium]